MNEKDNKNLDTATNEQEPEERSQTEETQAVEPEGFVSDLVSEQADEPLGTQATPDERETSAPSSEADKQANGASAELEANQPAKKPRNTAKIILASVAAVVVVASVVAALFYTHVLCIHEWKDATCTEPQVCGICGRTQGEPLGHEATDWKITVAATCTSEGIQEAPCVRCGQIQTDSVAMLPHTEGDWEVTEDWHVNTGGGIEAGARQKKCTACGKILDSEPFSPTLTAQEEGACKSAALNLSSGIGVSRASLIQNLESSDFTEAESTLAVDHCNADWNQQAVMSAKWYMQASGASHSSMIEWLTTYQKFTDEQAEFACQEVGL